MLERVTNDKNLAIHQFLSPGRTSSFRYADVKSRVVQYKNVILGATRSEVDWVKVCSTLWCNVALPGLLYAANVVPFPG